MRCAISRMQITGVPTYKCPFCSCLIHKEMEAYLPVMSCPYCDVPLQKNMSKLEESSGTVDDQISVIETGVSEDCFDDCIGETVDLKDISEDPCSAFVESGSYCSKVCPDWDALSVSDLSSDDECSEVDVFKKIVEKEIESMKRVEGQCDKTENLQNSDISHSSLKVTN